MRPKRHYRHMSPLAARVIRELYFVGKLKQREIGWLFGIKQNTVSRIVSGLVWAEVPEVRTEIPGRVSALAHGKVLRGMCAVQTNPRVYRQVQEGV